MEATQTKNAIAYGSLYLDQGETMDMVKKQIRSFTKHKNIKAMFFDVLDNNNTVSDEVGQQYVERVLEYARKKLPEDVELQCAFSRAD